jgi:hypothetical protein
MPSVFTCSRKVNINTSTPPRPRSKCHDLSARSHAFAMLTYSDRQKFEQIRARWESAPPTGDQPSTMAGRKEKPAAHQSLNADANNGGSKFRRKLSHGLSFISNPLSQRKTTPGQLQPGCQPLAPAAAAIALDHNTSTSSDKLLSPVRDSRSFDDLHHSSAPRTTREDDATTQKDTDPNSTPKPLPRSQTMSYIPRPNRTTSESSTVESETTQKQRSPQLTFATKPGTSRSKIPSPPATGRRLPSPRQYFPQHTAQQSKHIAAGMAFAPAPAETQASPSKASVRSYTTPNLMERNASPHPGSFMMPRKLALQHRHARSPSVQRLSMKENCTPIGKRDSHRILQTQDASSRRASLAVPAVTSKRGSLGLNGSPRQSKQTIRTTPPNANRLSTSLATQTPLTARRMQPNSKQSFQSSTTYRYCNGSSIAQPRLMGPVNPPTLQVVDQVAAQPALPRASTDKDLRETAFSRAPSEVKGKGMGMASRGLVGGNTEVRQRLPRSHTFHNFWSHRDMPPPLPPMPAIYKSFSQPLLVVRELPKEESNEPLSFIFEDKSSDHGWNFGSLDSKSENLMEASSPFIVDLDDANLDKQAKPGSDPNWPLGPSIALASPLRSDRPWSIHDQHVESSDTDGQVQVKDYMPPLWWAGRFQSRFDQWRTEAMLTEPNPKYKPEGMPGRCSLSQEKVATCYIFLQLRDLCVSNQAADSLWVSTLQVSNILRECTDGPM